LTINQNTIAVKVLIVCSGNTPYFSFEKHQAFIYDQIKAISKYYSNVQFDTFFIIGKGIRGYLRNRYLLNRKIENGEFDLIHAHYGLSGVLSVLQNKLPVVTTFHNGEILNLKINIISSIAAFRSSYSIFVAKHIGYKLLFKPKRKDVIPCGIDLDNMRLIDINTARKKMNLKNGKNILFGGAFNNRRKNYPLIKKAIEITPELKDCNLIELKGYSRKEVNYLINACDVMVLPTLAEGSPQIIKEAMACNCPIVSTDVGDVFEIIGDTEGCYICSYEPADLAEKIKMALGFGKRTNGRAKIKHLDNKLISEKIVNVYKYVIKNEQKGCK